MTFYVSSGWARFLELEPSGEILEPFLAEVLDPREPLGQGAPQHFHCLLCVPDSDSLSSPTRLSLSLSEGEEQVDRLQQVELVRTTPMSHWKAGTVQAWLEVVMAMPMYVKACGENVKSGKVGEQATSLHWCVCTIGSKSAVSAKAREAKQPSEWRGASKARAVATCPSPTPFLLAAKLFGGKKCPGFPS